MAPVLHGDFLQEQSIIPGAYQHKRSELLETNSKVKELKVTMSTPGCKKLAQIEASIAKRRTNKANRQGHKSVER